MTSPWIGEIPVFAYMPLLNVHKEETTKVYVSTEDMYSKKYRHLGLSRDEMMYLMSGICHVDVLTNNESLKYFGEK